MVEDQNARANFFKKLRAMVYKVKEETPSFEIDEGPSFKTAIQQSAAIGPTVMNDHPD